MSAMCGSLFHPTVWRQIYLNTNHSTLLYATLLYSTLLYSAQVHTVAYWVLLFLVHVISTYFPASNCLYLFISITSLPNQFTPIQLQSTLPYPFQILLPHPFFVHLPNIIFNIITCIQRKGICFNYLSTMRISLFRLLHTSEMKSKSRK